METGIFHSRKYVVYLQATLPRAPFCKILLQKLNSDYVHICGLLYFVFLHAFIFSLGIFLCKFAFTGSNLWVSVFCFVLFCHMNMAGSHLLE